MQTRWQSFFESYINVAIGYGVALMSQILIFPLFGIHIPLAKHQPSGPFSPSLGHRSAATRCGACSTDFTERKHELLFQDQTIGEFRAYHGDCVKCSRAASEQRVLIRSRPCSPASTLYSNSPR